MQGNSWKGLARLGLSVALGGCSASSSTMDNSGEPFTLGVSVTGSASHVGNVQVCANYRSTVRVCGPDGGFRVGSMNSIPLSARAGESYTVVVPTDQQASAYCSVTSGNSGVFGPSMATAIVSCI